MASSTQIRIPDDFPEGERFSMIKERFRTGTMRTIIFNEVKAQIFNAELMVFFATPGLKLEYTATGEEVQRTDLFKAFVEGYAEGKARFKELYTVPPAVLFSNPKPYIESLHEACFHSDPITGKESFAWIKKVSQFPYHLTNLKSIREKGFYSGLYASVMKLKDLYPRSFATFDECHLEKKDSSPEGLTNFEQALRLKYLNKAGLIEYPSRKKLEEQGRFQVYKEGWLKLTGKKKREPKKEELEKVYDSLSEYPEVQKAVINDIDVLKNRTP